jgi:hypothetical protein
MRPTLRAFPGPSLTPALRDRRSFAQAGMKEWLRRGAKKNGTKQERKMPSDQIP